VPYSRPAHTPDQTTEKLPIPLQNPTHDVPKLLKAASNVFVAEEQALHDPEDLAGETTTQIGLYAHPCQDSRTSGHRLGCQLLLALPLISGLKGAPRANCERLPTRLQPRGCYPTVADDGTGSAWVTRPPPARSPAQEWPVPQTPVRRTVRGAPPPALGSAPTAPLR
jgi:hypothetical protein